MFIPSYKKPGGGGSYTPPTWSDGTDAEIIEALEKHYNGEIDLHDYWSVGDERIVHLSAMSAMSPLSDTHPEQDVIFVLSETGGKYLVDENDQETNIECVFQVDQKNTLSESGSIHSTNSTIQWADTQRKEWCNTTYYNSMPSTLKSAFKKFKNVTIPSNGTGFTTTHDYFSLRSHGDLEVVGGNEGTYNPQIEWYKTSSNKIKKLGTTSTDTVWWLRYNNGSANMYWYVTSAGGTSTLRCNSTRNLAPFGVI